MKAMEAMGRFNDELRNAGILLAADGLKPSSQGKRIAFDGPGRTVIERQMAILAAARFQDIRSTHCAREGPGSNGSPKYWVSRATFPSRNSMMLTV
jgi:hypothetical protein